MDVDYQLPAIGRLLFIQNVLEALPDEGSISSFLSKALLDIPGVQNVCVHLWPGGALLPAPISVDVQPLGLVSVFPLSAGERQYGEVKVHAKADVFSPYLPHFSNAMNLVAALLEKRGRICDLAVAGARAAHSNELLTVEVARRNEELLAKNLVLEHEIGERKKLQEELATLLDALPVGIAWASEATGALEYVNPKFVALFGYGLDDIPTMADWSLFAYPDFEYRREVIRRWELANLQSLEKAGEVGPIDVEIRCSNGRTKHVRVTGRRALGRSLAVFDDFTEQRKYQDELARLSNHDSLTGLPNRSLLRDRLSQAIYVARRHLTHLAVLFIDINHFKLVNEVLGQEQGDELIIEVARRVRSCIRPDETVGRNGGNEFVVILPGVESGEEALNIAKRIAQTVEAPFGFSGNEIVPSVSIGVSIFPEDGQTEVQLLRTASAALHEAKKLGRGRVVSYTPEFGKAVVDRFALENGLRNSLVRGQIQVHYHPQVESQTGRVLGFEALARWEHPEFGFIPPAQFIPLAEEIGQITRLGAHVMRTACEQAKVWHEGGHLISVAVNVSAHELRDRGFVARIKDTLVATGLPPEYLELELTETAVVEQPEIAAAIIGELRDFGVHFSLDDFGTGYSSLSYLHRFRFSSLKIDRSFIKDVVSDADGSAIVTAIIAMAHKLKLRVVAEGVEAPAQLDFLRTNACDLIQGHLISPPMGPASATAFLDTGSAAS